MKEEEEISVGGFSLGIYRLYVDGSESQLNVKINPRQLQILRAPAPPRVRWIQIETTRYSHI